VRRDRHRLARHGGGRWERPRRSARRPAARTSRKAFVRLTAGGGRPRWGAWLVVFLKEIRDALRDRRTALWCSSPPWSRALTLVLVAQFVSGLEDAPPRSRCARRRAARAGARHFLRRRTLRSEEAPEDYAARVEEGHLEAVIVSRATSTSAGWTTRRRAWSCVRRFPAPSPRPRSASRSACWRPSTANRVPAPHGAGREPSPQRNVKVERGQCRDAATARCRAACPDPHVRHPRAPAGRDTLAIDATAGERERGSLGALLANPVSTAAFAFGKCSRVGERDGRGGRHAGGLRARRGPYAERKLPALLQFGAGILRFVAIVVPLAAFTSARRCSSRRTAAPTARRRPT